MSYKNPLTDHVKLFSRRRELSFNENCPVILIRVKFVVIIKVILQVVIISFISSIQCNCYQSIIMSLISNMHLWP